MIICKGGYYLMSSDGNLLQIIFDGIWGTVEIIVRAFTKKEEKKEPLDIFFNKVGLCNKDQEYPTVVETTLEKEENVYKIWCPIGLGKSDFEKYSDALEIYLGKKIEVKSTKGFIYIK
ncbi:hypothetical protein SDC9_95538 [bioreactor metagenome]|uniref:Uncharacterized protein n=1 Tax=bioreactor metagenome TaxID=1076179 RepID=A0A645A960_9ZZZZ